MMARHHEMIERAHSAEYSALRLRTDADVMERGGKLLEVFKFGIQRTDALAFEEVEQFLDVTLISLQRVRGVSPLQPKVPVVSLHQVSVAGHALMFICFWRLFLVNKFSQKCGA